MCGGGGGCYLAGYAWLWPKIEVVVILAVDFFLGSGIYYFIIVVILFYCDIYIILLC